MYLLTYLDLNKQMAKCYNKFKHTQKMIMLFMDL